MTSLFTTHSFSSFDGLKLSYRLYAPPSDKPSQNHDLLCLSGLSRNSSDFHSFASLMQKKGHRIISLDYRGRGLSEYDPNPKNYHLETYIEDVRHLLASLHLHQVIVIGSSLGGLIAMGMGAAFPRTLAGVVLNDVGPEIDIPWIKNVAEKLERNHSFATWNDAIQHVKKAHPWLENLSEKQWRERTELAFSEDSHARITRKWDLHVLDNIKKYKKPQSLWNPLKSLAPFPLLLVRGEISDFLPNTLFQSMISYLQKIKSQKKYPPLLHVTVPERGHVPDLNEPSFIKTFETFHASIGKTS
jgi:pimeloyl-ACP methyl ester carboxylesterase